MFTKTQKFLLFSGLTGGYFVYRAALKHVVFNNQNVFIGNDVIEDLKHSTYGTIGQNRVILSNPLNKKYSPEKRRIVIIGGGIVGASTAYELSKNPQNDVILLEKNPEVGNETSYANGTIFCPSLCYPWTSFNLFKKVWSSMFASEHPVSITYKIIFEEHLGTWLLNALRNITSSGAEDSARKLIYVARESQKVLDELKLKVNLKEKVDLTSRGTITLYSSKEKLDSDKPIRDVKEKLGLHFKILDKNELLKSEPFCAGFQNQVEYGVVSYEDTNADSLKLTNLLCELAEKNGATIYKETEFQRFVFNREKMSLAGVITDQGTILCDAAIIAGGYSSKKMTSILGIRLPLIPASGYTLTMHNKNHHKVPLNHSLVDDTGLAHMAPLNDKVRVSGVADIGVVNEFNQSRLNMLLNRSKVFLGDMEVDEKSFWTGVRPFSPDDVPIIGKVKANEEIYINSGHGSKGLTLSMGSARILKSIMEKNASKEMINDYSIKRFHLI